MAQPPCKMSKYIVITTINQPSEAVRRFSELPDYRVVVVGDRKTPAEWYCENVDFLAASGPCTDSFALGSRLPFNSYARKNLGYLYAIRSGAEAIVDTDDDNIPKPDWEFPPFDGVFEQSQPDLGFVNVYKSYTDAHIWPRGFPLDLINTKSRWLTRDGVSSTPVKVGVWQGLVDQDPDVDAIYRLVVGEPCTFSKGAPIVLASGTTCPFNSQNTIFAREVFPLLYLPSSVSMRFTDILRGLVAQPILWRHGCALGFTGPTALQVRNPHDYLDDFRLEVSCYLNTYTAVNAVEGAVRSGLSLADNLVQAYEALHAAAIVDRSELELLDLWIKDLAC